MSTLKGALWSTRTMVFSGLHVSYNKSSVSGLALIRQARQPGGGLRSELVLDIFTHQLDVTQLVYFARLK